MLVRCIEWRRSRSQWVGIVLHHSWEVADSNAPKQRDWQYFANYFNFLPHISPLLPIITCLYSLVTVQRGDEQHRCILACSTIMPRPLTDKKFSVVHRREFLGKVHEGPCAAEYGVPMSLCVNVCYLSEGLYSLSLQAMSIQNYVAYNTLPYCEPCYVLKCTQCKFCTLLAPLGGSRSSWTKPSLV